MKCPKCRVELVAQTAKGDVRLDCCPDCRGIWFDAGELEKIMKDAQEDLYVPAAAKQQYLFCPRCVQYLHSFHYPQTEVMIEMCKSCGGLWLDGAEYTKIRKMRDTLARLGKLDAGAQPGRIKGTLLHWVNSAIDALSS